MKSFDLILIIFTFFCSINLVLSQLCQSQTNGLLTGIKSGDTWALISK